MLVLLSETVSGKNKEVTVYYSNWSIYQSCNPLYARNIPINLVDTVIYAFVNVDQSGNVMLSDPESDTNAGNLRGLSNLKKHAKQNGRKLITLFSVGGWGKGSDPFPALSASNKSRENFARQAVEFCKKYDFDGMDVDWEFPKNEEEGRNFFLLLLKVFQKFKKENPDLLLTAAVPGLPDHYKKIPWLQVSRLLDRVHVMTYDLHGPWKDPENMVTNHQCALGIPILGNPDLNIQSVMQFYESYFRPDILYVGIPLFFNTYADANEGIPPSHYGSPYSGPGTHPTDPDAKGTLLYREVMRDLELGAAQGFWDPYSIAFSVYYPSLDMFGSGMNPLALKKTIQYTKSSEYRGVMIWELRGDTKDWSALKLINEGL